MFNIEMRDKMIEEFTQGVAENAERNLSNLDLAGFMNSNDVDAVKACVEKIQANVISAIPEGYSVPKISLYVSASGNDTAITLVTVTITNRVRSERKFKFSYSTTADNCVKALTDFFMTSYAELVVSDMIDVNLAKVNEVLKTAGERAGLGYDITMVSPLGNEGKKISFMCDDSITFVADEERVFDLDDILALQELEEVEETESDEENVEGAEEADETVVTAELLGYTNEHIEEAINQIAEQLAKAQTPEQLVGIHGGMLVELICDINTQVRPMTLIKKVTNRNVLKLTGNKDTIAYFADGDVFALVAKHAGKEDEDGNTQPATMEVILSPFDIKTLRKVDYDVLKAIEA